MATAPKNNDTPWRELRAIVKGVQNVALRVGIVGSAATKPHAGGDLTNAEVGAIHEFGAPAAGIPERSFVRSTFRVRRAELAQVQAAAAKAIISKRMHVRQALGIVGAWAAGAVKEQILVYGPFLFQPLAPATILAKIRKGAPNPTAPLVETGELAKSVSFVVIG